MPRIIFITTLPIWSMGKGKGAVAFFKTLEKYINVGWQVYLISDAEANKDYPYLDKDQNIVIKSTPFKKFGALRKIGLAFRWLDHLIMTKKFINTSKKIILSNISNKTVLYAYEVFGVKACQKLSKEFSLPFVTRFQGTILSQYRNNFINRIRNYPHYQALSQNADLVIMTDDGTQGELVLKSLKNKSKILFLRNGLDLIDKDLSSLYSSFDYDFFRAKLGIKYTDLMFLTVSRLTGWKKIDRAIDGFAKCIKKCSNARLVIVGDGDKRNFLENKAVQLGVSEFVVFAGSVSQDQVYKYIMASDVFLSLYDLSNVGNPLLEAMTLGKCIVTLDVGDTKKLIINRENGILLTYETLPSLGDILIEIAENATLRMRLGAAAAAYARKHFYSWEERLKIEYMEVEALIKKEI